MEGHDIASNWMQMNTTLQSQADDTNRIDSQVTDSATTAVTANQMDDQNTLHNSNTSTDGVHSPTAANRMERQNTNLDSADRLQLDNEGHSTSWTQCLDTREGLQSMWTQELQDPG